MPAVGPTMQGHVDPVALLNVLVKRSPQEVWEFLSDGHRYAEWVVGTREIRSVDAGWPAEGTCIHYTVGHGPLALADRTTVRNADPPRTLELEVQAGRLGTVRVHLEIRRWGEHAVVVMDEHPLSGPGLRLHNVVVEMLLRVRNRRALDRLAQAVERQDPIALRAAQAPAD